jgi:hypothetical protein
MEANSSRYPLEATGINMEGDVDQALVDSY